MSLTSVSLLLAVLFIVCGLIFSQGKGKSLLSAFVMLTPEERKKINVKRLCKKMSIVLYIYAVGFLLMALFTELDWTFFYFIAIAIFLYGIGRTMHLLQKAKDNLL